MPWHPSSLISEGPDRRLGVTVDPAAQVMCNPRFGILIGFTTKETQQQLLEFPQFKKCQPWLPCMTWTVPRAETLPEQVPVSTHCLCRFCPIWVCLGTRTRKVSLLSPSGSWLNKSKKNNGWIWDGLLDYSIIDEDIWKRCCMKCLMHPVFG